ncbi:MAG: hypothetical protein ACR2GL_08725 [Thermoleophilaceae bacterium]
MLLTALLSVALVAPATAPAAEKASASRAADGARAPLASAAARCRGSIRLGGRRYAFWRHRVRCGAARRAVRRLFASRGRRGSPRGFRCRSRSRFRKTGACSTRGLGRYFGFSR